tara:strand:- start:106 stop:216 length:111 start_codon:yes stop_codon:yes gene_type:complete
MVATMQVATMPIIAAKSHLYSQALYVQSKTLEEAAP